MGDATELDATETGPPARGRLWTAYAAAVVWARWWIVVGWLGATVAVTMLAPTLGTTGSGGFGSLIPADSEAVQAQQRSVQEFGIPLLVDTIVVAHNPAGLPPATQRAIAEHAARIARTLPGLDVSDLPTDRPLAAVPVPNTVPITRDGGDAAAPVTTVLSYLYFAPSLSLAEQTSLAQRYAATIPTDGGTQVAVTGTVPASVAQADVAASHLRLVEIATVGFVFLVVALVFRSVVAPLVTLTGAVLAYLVAMHVLGFVGRYIDLSLPPPLEPLIVALLLGILTDYSVFYFTEMRRQLAGGTPRRAATRSSLRDNTPIIAVAGLTVAVGTAALYVSRVQVYRVFGPGLAISVAIGVAVAVTFVPAAMAILGRGLFWPSHPATAGRHSTAADGAGGRDTRASWPIRAVTTRAGAAVATLLTVGGLAAAAMPLRHAELDISFIRGLPAGVQAQVGAHAVTTAFPAGVLGPTVVLVEAPGVTDRRDALARLQSELEGVPGVAAVIGPANDPLTVPRGVLLAEDSDAARYLVVLDADPLSGPAIATVDRIDDRAASLLAGAGLGGARLSVAGESAIAAAAAQETAANLWLVLGAAFAAEFLIIACYLRALLAPVLLLCASALVVAAALGLTTLVFQDLLHSGGLTFYAPFATAVLLVALGSDYNVFGVGRIWEEGARRPLRSAMRTALPESTRAITTAGVILAGSFAMIALIPLLAFREMAFTMFVGLLLDTFLVRSVLTPALLTLAGPASGWPGHRLLDRRSARPAPG